MGDGSDKNIPCSQLHLNAQNVCIDENHLANDRLLAILYTSGSTGVPKGARILHSGAVNRLRWQWTEFPYRKQDVCMFKVNLYITYQVYLS